MERCHVRPSGIPGAGGGLYASVALRKGECLGRYEGRRLSAAEALGDPHFVRGYLMQVGSGYVDGRDPAGRLVLDDGSEVDVSRWTDAEWRRRLGRGGRGVAWRGVANLMRFVNAGDRGGTPANCVLTRTCGGTGFKTKWDVACGEELLANYGGSYWGTANDDTCSKCILPGLLLECDGCTRSYHLKCAGVKKGAVPKGKWYCPSCKKRLRCAGR